MKFNISEALKPQINSLCVGNVYNVRGGYGARLGYMSVIIAIRDAGATTLTIDRDGNIVGSANYAIHYWDDKTPMAFVRGLEELTFEMENL